jgi:thiol-disulfide isomerase/thioredoxin
MRLKAVTRPGLVAALLVLAAAGLPAQDQTALDGRWDAAVTVNRLDIPFQLEITGTGAAVKASFFNGGDRRISSTSATSNGASTTFNFDQLATKLVISHEGTGLTGEYQRGGTRAPYPFKATRSAVVTRVVSGAPQIGGTWIVPARGNKGETAWKFIVTQTGAEITAAILRIDGDTGALTGTWHDGKFILSHFDGGRPLLMEVTPVDGTKLRLRQNNAMEFDAVRDGAPEAKAIGVPDDPAHHTTVRDPNEVFAFNFPDLNGRMVSNEDPRFKGKVLLLNIGGSWCPNCHDEAPFIASLYKKYQSQGLEVIGLSFESADDMQAHDFSRLQAYIKEYDIKYTMLVPGSQEQLNEKIPQGVNLNSFPTTFFVGRDGRVRGAHAGFPSPGSGEYYTEAEREVTALVEQLLAERAPGAR